MEESYPEYFEPVASETTAHYVAAIGIVTSFTPTAAGPNNAAVTLATIPLPSDEKGVFMWDIGYPAGTNWGELLLKLEGGTVYGSGAGSAIATTNETLVGTGALANRWHLLCPA
jgi:hypothetical protein